MERTFGCWCASKGFPEERINITSERTTMHMFDIFQNRELVITTQKKTTGFLQKKTKICFFDNRKTNKVQNLTKHFVLEMNIGSVTIQENYTRHVFEN